MRLFLLIFLVAFCITSHAQTVPAGIVSSPAKSGSNPAASSTETGARAKAKSESWTELSLDKSGLPQSIFNAVRLGKYDEATYTRELVRVEWRYGDPIELSVVIPKGVTKPPVILYLYDYTADGTRFQDNGWCKRATRDGFAAVGFVSALSGQRFHSPRPMKQWFVSELQESLATSTHDVQMVLNYLAVRGDLDLSRTGMLAQGSGGAVAILASSVDPRISALDLINPWGDWPDWVANSAQIPDEERAVFVTPEFLGRVAALDPVNSLPHLMTKALRIQQIVNDTVTPAAAREKIAASVPSPAKQVVRYANATAHQEAWRNDGLTGWLREQLKPSPADQTLHDGATNR